MNVNAVMEAVKVTDAATADLDFSAIVDMKLRHQRRQRQNHIVIDSADANLKQQPQQK